MKIITLFIVLFPAYVLADTGIEFPPNHCTTDFRAFGVGYCNGLAEGNSMPLSEVHAFFFDDVSNNGLPMYGTADGGVTYSWDIYPNDPGGSYSYWTTFFYDRNDGCFVGTGASCDGTYRSFYYGAHPYPWASSAARGGSQLTHAWEISTGTASAGDYVVDSGDDQDTETVVIDYDQWYSQALVVTKNGSSVTMKFYVDLPSVADSDVIEITQTQNTGTFSVPSNPDLYFADAPWADDVSHHETLNGIIRNIKIWDGTKAEQYLKDNAGVDTQLTKAGDSDLWYHNPNPTPDDISDKSGGTAHNPSWVDANFKPNLWESIPVPATFIGNVLGGGSFQ